MQKLPLPFWLPQNIPGIKYIMMAAGMVLCPCGVAEYNTDSKNILRLLFRNNLTTLKITSEIQSKLKRLF